MALRAMVVGAGSAGEGHAMALRQAGTEVVAIASRTASVVSALAARLGIPVASTDWRATLRELWPDIVAVATPGDSHAAIIDEALAAGAHLYVDKPFAPTAAEARRLWAATKSAGVRSAYAATSNYQPSALLARALVAEGAIGELLEAEFVSHYHWHERLPHGWPHRLADGGGRLNNNFTHKLAIAESVCGGATLAVAGETRNDLGRAPIVPFPHDFRDWTRALVPEEQARAARWGEVDSDWSYTVLARIGAPGSDPAAAPSVTFRHSCLRKGKHQDYVALYGRTGTIHVDQAYCQGDVHLWREGEAGFSVVPMRADILASLPPVEAQPHWAPGWDVPARAWNALARDFVADIEGRAHAPYFTLADGLRHQEVIDAVRARSGWSAVPAA
ncbi:MAG: Gfo/Idh/MocA family oxidoreductase [Alphaproteobacteria bacterium]|nr:Gfo/Idh/MocA family oxidoreductase [Alphaproteobacteria bacterium]